MLRDQTARELHNPASVRRQLGEAWEEQSPGEMSQEQLTDVENDALDRLYPFGDASARTPAPDDGS